MDWSYEMRREMQEILPGLFLGPFGVAKDFQKLKAANITHVLLIRSQLEHKTMTPRFPNDFIYEVVSVPEGPTENLILYFHHCITFIRNVLSQGGRVLVHCNAGLTRSATIVVAYVMETLGLPYQDAILYVQKKRCCIHIREALHSQLREYECIYKNREACKVFNVDSNSNNNDQRMEKKKKRSLLEEEEEEDSDDNGDDNDNDDNDDDKDDDDESYEAHVSIRKTNQGFSSRSRIRRDESQQDNDTLMDDD